MKILRPLIVVAACIGWGYTAEAAECYITEFAELAADELGNELQLANLSDATAEQNVTYTTSAASAAMNASTRYVRIICDAKAHFAVGSSPTATSSNTYVTADTAEYFAINPGEQIAFYDGTS